MNNKIEGFFEELKDVPGFGSCVMGINAKGALGDTPLHVAAIQGQIDIVQALVEAGADVNAQGEHQCTPLHEALAQGHRDIASYLIAKGASLDLPNSDNITPRQMMV